MHGGVRRQPLEMPAHLGGRGGGCRIALPGGDYRAEFLVRPLAPGGYVVAEVTSDFGRDQFSELKEKIVR